jgi:hypothetical protein
MHVYEFDRRVLVGEKEIAEAVSGRKLTHPRTNSRWTEELAPGLATFASLKDDELYPVSVFVVQNVHNNFFCIGLLFIITLSIS